MCETMTRMHIPRAPESPGQQPLESIGNDGHVIEDEVL
jgi:hypothetical protein